MAQVTTTATVGALLPREQLWTTKKHQTERIRVMAKPRRAIKGQTGQRFLNFSAYSISRPISLPTSWTYKMTSPDAATYSVARGARYALRDLLKVLEDQLPPAFTGDGLSIKFDSASPAGEGVYIPSPLRNQDAIAAIKALEGCAAAAIANLRYNDHVQRNIAVDLDKAACFLMSAYLTTIEGKGKGDPESKDLIKNTDLNQAQSLIFNRLLAGLYETKDGKYYHIHGSLDVRGVADMLNLLHTSPEHDAGGKKWEYAKARDTIAAAVKTFTAKELEEKNSEKRMAGIEALKWEQFLKTPHGKVVCSLPPFTVSRLEASNQPENHIPPRPFSDFNGTRPDDRRVLSGIKVIEMCRVIAGPTIGRSLAAHGALVIKVTSSRLPDVPFFQVDVNTGKHTTDLNLTEPADREAFEKLLADADILIDGYRPGSLQRLGYGPNKLARVAKDRGFGFVYVAEDCFGGLEQGAEWSDRPGWQQIADCVTGVAWAQGDFMGKNAPVVPPFPMSDYGTGALGCIAAMVGLYRRATEGGSWTCRTSLCQYDIFLQKLKPLPASEQNRLREDHSSDFIAGVQYNDSVDVVSERALKSLWRLTPHLFNEKLVQSAKSPGFNRGEPTIRWPREAIRIPDLHIGHVRPSRNNGYDRATWDDWEEDQKMVAELTGKVFTETGGDYYTVSDIKTMDGWYNMISTSKH